MRVENFGWCLLLTKTCSHWLVGSKTLNLSDRYIHSRRTQNEALFKEVIETVTFFQILEKHCANADNVLLRRGSRKTFGGFRLYLWTHSPRDKIPSGETFTKTRKKPVLPTKIIWEKLKIKSAAHLRTQVRIPYIHYFLRRLRNKNLFRK